MQRIKLQTLIDVTCSKAKRAGEGNTLEQNQYRNWTTILQGVGLRSTIVFEHNPTSEIKKLKGTEFGSAYTGEHTVWTFEFTTDRDDVYFDQENPLYLLIEDLHLVPVIKNLTETINIDKSVFDLKSPKYRNTTVSLV